MKGLKRTLLLCSTALASVVAEAELKLLGDAELSHIEGQAGLTIDIETKRNIREFAYKDGGFVLQKNMGIGGSKTAEEIAFGNNGFLDNLRLTLDVAGNGSSPGVPDNQSSYGFSDMIDYAAVHVNKGNTNAGMEAAAGLLPGGPIDVMTGLEIDRRRTVDDGDLVIHLSATDAWQKGGGFNAYDTGSGDNGSGGTTDFENMTYEGFRNITSRAVDYSLTWDAVGLAASDYQPGTGGMETYTNARTGKQNGTNHQTGQDSTPDTTVLLSGIEVNGYLGPVDIRIDNDGNGYGADGSSKSGIANTGNADSKIYGEAFFNVDYEIYIDIAGLQLEGIKIHNTRGDLGSMNRNSTDTGFTSSFGFAHGQRDIYAVNENVINTHMDDLVNDVYIDGMGYDTRFKGDVDIGHISFGDTGESIGKLYLTDFQFTRNWVISAH